MALRFIKELQAELLHQIQAYEWAAGECAFVEVCPVCLRNRWIRALYARLEPWGA